MGSAGKHTAIIFSLFNADAYRLRMLSLVVQRLNTQSIDLFFSLSVLNGHDLVLPDLQAWDQVVRVSGNTALFQKEALANAAVRELPGSITKLIFLDADIFPLNPDWAKAIEQALSDHDLVQGYSLLFYLSKQSTRRLLASPLTPFFHGELVDDTRLAISNRRAHTESVPVAYPSFGYTRGIGAPGAMGGCLAFRRDFFERIGGFPYEEIFAGLNDVLLFYRLSLYSGETLSRAPNSLVNKYSENKLPNCRFKFIPQRLYHLWHKTGEAREYDQRLKLSVTLAYHPERDIFLNHTGGIELTKEGMRLQAPCHEINLRALQPDPALY